MLFTIPVHGSHVRSLNWNCAAVFHSISWKASFLVWHEKSAFTGAIAQKVGRFELADKGTLFLDEVGRPSVGTAAQTSTGSAGAGVRALGWHADSPSRHPPHGYLRFS